MSSEGTSARLDQLLQNVKELASDSEVIKLIKSKQRQKSVNDFDLQDDQDDAPIEATSIS